MIYVVDELERFNYVLLLCMIISINEPIFSLYKWPNIDLFNLNYYIIKFLLVFCLPTYIKLFMSSAANELCQRVVKHQQLFLLTTTTKIPTHN